MERNMELIRKILLCIEKNYVDTWLDSSELQVNGYDMKTVAYHCSIMQDAGLISEYKGHYANNELQDFGVGHLTWDGHELLDKIKNDTVWNRTKSIVKEKCIPFVLDAVREIATGVTTAMIQSAIAGIQMPT